MCDMSANKMEGVSQEAKQYVCPAIESRSIACDISSMASKMSLLAPCKSTTRQQVNKVVNCIIVVKIAKNAKCKNNSLCA